MPLGGTAVQSQKQEFHYHAAPEPRVPPPPKHQPSQPQEIRPRIIFLGAKQQNVRFGEHCIFETNDLGSARVVKACFRNEVKFGEPSKDALGVKAHLRFFDKNKSEIGEGVSGVTWLGENSHDSINLPKNQSACLCILITDHKGTDNVLVPWRRRVPSMGGYGYVVDRTDLPELPSIVEVRLDDSKGLLLPPILLDITVEENGDLTVTKREQGL